MRDVKLLDYLLGALLVGIALLPLPEVGFPLDNLVVAALVGLGLLRNPQHRLGRYELLVPLCIAALFFLGVHSMFAVASPGAADWQTRLLRFMAISLLVLVVGTGRIDGRSLVYGVATALLLNVPLFYAGIVPSPYGNYLTGLVGDKNVAGLAYAVIGLLVMLYVRSTPWRVTWGLVFAACLWLTGSRTSITAFGAAIVWALLAPRLPVLGRWVLGLVTVVTVDLLSEDYSRIGVFSDREGSDQLRARIDAASEAKVQDAGFWGKGLGEAFVDLQDRTWFFHNSYWTALVEGGWPWLVLVVGVTVLIIVRPFTKVATARQFFIQGVGVAILICSWRLGEVFMTAYWAIAMGVALQQLLANRPPGEGEVEVPAPELRRGGGVSA